MKGHTFILKYSLQFACTNLDGSQKEGVTLRGVPERGGGFPQNRGAGGVGGTKPAGNYVTALLTKEKQLN